MATSAPGQCHDCDVSSVCPRVRNRDIGFDFARPFNLPRCGWLTGIVTDGLRFARLRRRRNAAARASLWRGAGT
jgi:hypothetical protein